MLLDLALDLDEVVFFQCDYLWLSSQLQKLIYCHHLDLLWMLQHRFFFDAFSIVSRYSLIELKKKYLLIFWNSWKNIFRIAEVIVWIVLRTNILLKWPFIHYNTWKKSFLMFQWEWIFWFRFFDFYDHCKILFKWPFTQWAFISTLQLKN